MSFRSKLKPKSATDAIEEEARKLKENEETALVLQQFIETFEEPVNVHKTWVKGGTVTPGSSIQTFEGAGRMYQPYLKTAEKAAEKLKEKIQPEVEKMSILCSKKDQAKKKSNLEAFSEELKQIQQEREMRMIKRKAVVEKVEDINSKFSSGDIEIKPVEEIRKSRFDSAALTPVVKTPQMLLPYPYDLDNPYENENDRTSTNLFLGNLNPELSEQQLCELFGRFGPLASVKIMWPRSEEEKARGRNCGFVAFMNRTDGERALDKLRGQEICGYEMKLGWGKTVLIPPHPIYIPPALQEMIKAPPPSGLPFNAQPRDWLEKHERGLSYDKQTYDMNSLTDEELSEILKSCVVKIVIPVDRQLVQLINRMVEFVVREGVEFEAFIMNKEMRNPHFRFLFDFQSQEHVYYRWKLYSILHGESPKTWKTTEFQMYLDGPFWRPPPLNPYTSGMPEELITDFDVSQITLENIKVTDPIVLVPTEIMKEPVNAINTYMENPYTHNNVYRKLLNDNQRDRLIDMLTNLEPTKSCVGETMVWCLEHSDSAEEVVDVIVTQIERSIDDSIQSVNNTTATTTTTHFNRLVAHIFLLSDILHNSCAKVRNASYYRKFIENILSQTMIDYNRYYLSITSKVKSEQLKHKVLSCFRAWGDWYVYPYDVLIKLQNQFLGIPEPVAVKVDDKAAETSVSGDNMLDRKPLVDYDGDPLDVDGVPLDSSNDTSETLISKKHDIIDMFANPNSPNNNNNNTKARDSAPLFVASKWETVDPQEEDSEMTQSRWNILESQMMEEDDKKSTAMVISDNDDPDGFPLSDNDNDCYDLSQIVLPTAKIDREQKISSSSTTCLVSYEKGDSSEEEEEEEHQRKVEKIKKKKRHHRVEEEQHEGEEEEDDNLRERRRRSPKRLKYKDGDSLSSSSRRKSLSNYKSEAAVAELKSQVVRVGEECEEASGRRSSVRRSSPRRSRDWDKPSRAPPSSSVYQEGKRRRSRSRSRSSGKQQQRSSHRRRSREKKR